MYRLTAFFIMAKFRKIKSNNEYLKTTKSFEGQSLEEKVFNAVNSKAPIEAVAPMVYTERKDGILPETNIRTDKWEVAQEAMTVISQGIQERRAKRILEKGADKPNSGGGATTDPQSVQNN